jgi:hypothetical protein
MMDMKRKGEKKEKSAGKARGRVPWGLLFILMSSS